MALEGKKSTMEYRIKRPIPHICIMFWTFLEASEITWFSFKAPNSKQLTLADHFPFAQHLPEPWDFFGRNDVKAETPVLWPPHAKSWLIGKDFDAGRDWGQEEKGTTQDEMARWHHWLYGRESEWTPGVGDGQGGLACWDSWGRKELDTTERLNWTELNGLQHIFHVYG